jgi:hypothetical protein
MMAVTKNTLHYLQFSEITREVNYNSTCTPLFNFVIMQKLGKQKYNEHLKALLNTHTF